jgi:hypothetical protein
MLTINELGYILGDFFSLAHLVTLCKNASKLKDRLSTALRFADATNDQGCQIFLDTINQNEGKYTKLSQHYQVAIKYTK